MLPRLLILPGSLRAASASRAVAASLTEALEGRAACAGFDIGSLPHYNADLAPAPEPVAAFTEAIAAAEGLVIVTPEYNYSIPGVLKNALDWASRPAYASVLRDKPVLIMSVSGGALGGVRAQSHLKYVLNGVLARVFPWQEIVIPHANGKIEAGRLQHAETEAFLDAACEAFLHDLQVASRAVEAVSGDG